MPLVNSTLLSRYQSLAALACTIRELCFFVFNSLVIYSKSSQMKLSSSLRKTSSKSL